MAQARGWNVLAWIVALGAVGFVVTMAVLSGLGRRAVAQGIHDGRLAPCPGTPNCVCSQDEDAGHHVEPFAYEGSASEAWACLLAAIHQQAGAHIAGGNNGYVHVEFTSAVFRFVDDGEFLMDPEKGVIHVRSASRVGRSDFGVNRNRVEAIRTAFNRLQASQAERDMAVETWQGTIDGPVTAEDQAAIRNVIERQLEAFQHDDAATAFSFAAPAIQGGFGSPDRFLQMVKQGYPAVYRQRSFEFLGLRTETAPAVQTVRLVDGAGQKQQAAYAMERQPDGTWRIGGCIVFPERE